MPANLHDARQTAPVNTRSTQWVTALGRRYLVALLVIAALAMVDQAVVQPVLLRQAFYAPVINVAGRQRMLSQRLSKAALALHIAESNDQQQQSLSELQATLDQWARAHHGLLAGDRQLELPGTNAPETLKAFSELQPHFTAMELAAKRLAESPPERTASANEMADRHLRTILIHEREYLSLMDEIVGQYQQQAQQQLWRLRALGLTIMSTVLLLLVGVGLYVLRPAMKTIQSNIASLAASESQLRDARDELEQRVLERTTELRQANASLYAEMQERQAMQAKMRVISDQLAHASRVNALGQLATGLAHEINQPLGAISNYAETADLLLSEHPAAHCVAREAIDAIKRAAIRAGSIVHRMRDFVKPAPANREEIQLESLVQTVCDLCHAETVRAGVEVEVELLDNLPPVIVDAIQIQQVLVNLMQNGVQAMTDAPRHARRLRITAHTVDEHVQITVADTGPGFAQPETESFFQPFYSTKTHGLGMGLSISRAIVERHDGRLWATTRAGQGAEVCFTLPLSPLPREAWVHEPNGVCR